MSGERMRRVDVAMRQVLGDEPTQQASLDGLRSAHGFLQSRVAGELRLKRTPELTFELDHTAERAARLEEILHDEERRA